MTCESFLHFWPDFGYFCLILAFWSGLNLSDLVNDLTSG